MSQPLRHQIKQTLLTLNQFITKLSKPKQLQYSMEIKNLLKVKDPESEKTLQTVLKNLEYKYNFLRLTNPQISKMLEKANSAGIQSKSAEGKEGESEESLIPSDLEYNMQSESFMEETTQGEESKLKTGKYVFKDGKLVEGEALKRKFVEFSNWYASNVDPEDLKRHKELLDRQHFRGPMWDGQPKPKSIMEETNPLINLDVDPEPNPALLRPKEDCFETVKR